MSGFWLMQTLLLTLNSPRGSVDLELPAEVPISALLPTLVRLCTKEEQANVGSWSLWVAEMQMPLDSSRTLLDAHIVDGTVLTLQSKSSTRPVSQSGLSQPGRPVFQPKSFRPGASSGGIGVKWHQPAQET